jgi:hypothetical protein
MRVLGMDVNTCLKEHERRDKRIAKVSAELAGVSPRFWRFWHETLVLA